MLLDTVYNLCFADDLALIAKSPEVLQRLLDEGHRISTEFTLDISTNKTKVTAARKASLAMQPYWDK